ncbi:MAG: phosphoglucosamine mutase [Verrucomicrobia bacterium]|nr:phosphoglucosamine mutase [Verrucomicrobiota bacterium]MBS0645271.1 phosphoglucosamine mutase [Verrucomicrobiota bacterium]
MGEHMKRLFGTDGIRGRANLYPTTPEIALALGKALATVLRRQGGNHRVVVGKDTRRSCYFFENAIIAGLCSMGVDTLMVGPLPTPGVAFITTAYRAAAGIMISASHNPFFDNGIKIFNSEGYKLSDELEAEIERIVLSGDFGALPADHEVGRNKRIDDVAGRYIENVKSTIPKGCTLAGMRLVIDCANGAACRVAPLVFWELGAEVIVRGDEPNGLNINDNCGALYPQALQQSVLDHQAHVGIAFDGDADRVQMVDENGQLVDGDQIMAICAQHLLETDALINRRVVVTVMSNYGLIKYLQKLGIEVITTKVGDRYVIQGMRDQDAYFGGEQSGHLIFRQYSPTGDGIIAALQVLRIMKETGKSLTQLTSSFKRYPQLLMNVHVRKKVPLEQLKLVNDTIAQMEALLKDTGRVLVRYSGTENLCRVMVEGSEQELVKNCCHTLVQAVEKEIGACAESAVI